MSKFIQQFSEKVHAVSQQYNHTIERKTFVRANQSEIIQIQQSNRQRGRERERENQKECEVHTYRTKLNKIKIF